MHVLSLLEVAVLEETLDLKVLAIDAGLVRIWHGHIQLWEEAWDNCWEVSSCLTWSFADGRCHVKDLEGQIRHFVYGDEYLSKINFFVKDIVP